MSKRVLDLAFRRQTLPCTGCERFGEHTHVRRLNTTNAMSHTVYMLYCVLARLLLCFRTVSAGDYYPSPKTPQTEFRVYSRFFANDSLIGRPVPCTRDEKICFRHNLIFHPTFNSCELAENVRINRTEFEHGSGRFLVASIHKRDPCTGYRMAYDGKCYEKEVVRGIICGRDANITMHPFGDKECRVTQANPISIQQPEEDGSCVIPDFRFPDWERQVFYNNPLNEIQGFQNKYPDSNSTRKYLQCESDQAACFSKGKIFVAGYGCFTLLKQGPCTEDHVVALDLQAAIQGQAEGTCVHERGGCPKGYKRMIFDGECHEDSEIALETPGDIILDQFGNYIIASFGVLEMYPLLNENLCILLFIITNPILGAVESVLSLPCGANDKGECKDYEVLNESPLPMP